MRKLLLCFAAVLVAAIGASVALADSPHFIGTPKATKSLTAGLTVSGKAAGLGNGPVTAFLTADSVSATYECVNHGGNVAPGQPIVQQNVAGPTEVIAPHNGQITFSVTIPPPSPPSPNVACPNGNWKVRITSLTFTNVVLHLQQPPGTDLLTANLGTIDP